MVVWRIECSDIAVPTFDRCVVLVADDEPAVLRLTSAALSHHGYEVISAPDGISALGVCQQRKGPIHLALLDIVMPGMTGPELFRRLQVLHPKLEVLFMSGYRPDDITMPHITPSQFIDKPFLTRTLVQRVNEILRNTQACALPDDEAEAATA